MSRIRFYFFIGLVLLLVACANQTKKSRETVPLQEETGEVEVSFWHTFNDEEAKTLKTVLREFQNLNPLIKVKLQQVPFSDALNKYKTVAQAGLAPDIFRSEIAWTPDLASMGYLMALDTFLSEDDLKDYIPQSLAYNRYRDHIWGIPQVTDCLALLYNKEKLAEAPDNLEAFVTIAKELTNPQKDEYGFFYRGDPYWYIPFIWAFGGDMIDAKDLSIKIADQPAVEALQFLIDLRDKHEVVPSVMDFANDYDNQQIGFKAGKYAMIINGPWSTADILAGDAFKNPDNLGIGRIPQGKGGYGSPVGGHNYVVASNTKHLTASWKLINFLNQPKYQARFALKNNLLPTRRSTYELSEVKSNRIIQDFKHVLDAANTRPVIPQGGALFVDLKPAFQGALLGEESPQQALDHVKKIWKTLLEKS